MSYDELNQPPSSQNRVWLFVLTGCFVLLACCACFGFLAVFGLAGWYTYQQQQLANVPPTASPTLFIPTPTATTTQTPVPLTASPTPPPTLTPTPVLAIAPPDAIDQRPIPDRAFADLNKLYVIDHPIHDYYEAAIRLGNYDLGPRTTTTLPYSLGDHQDFETDDGRIEATLMAITDHAYFWVEDGLDYSQAEVAEAANRLETEYYSRIVSLFGEPWNPGVDSDPHFSVLHLVGENNDSELGYFTSVDEYPNSLYRDSNEQEMIYMIMNNLDLGEELYFGTLVHEIQHLIQWYVDANETTWLNEGLSQFTEIYMGLDTVETDYYIEQPTVQLNTWGYEDDVVDAHYGAAYLYTVYVWEQLGETAVQELARHPANGLVAVNSVLQGYAPERSLEQFTADWAAANFLDDPLAGTTYNYENVNLFRPTFEERLEQPDLDVTKELNQFGVHYVELDFRSPVTITFAGDTLVDLTDSAPRSGEQMWYVAPSDETNAQLTAAFDLSAVNRATLSFAAWYDLEEDWDFAYVSISTDGGESWELLPPDHASPGDYGPGFNGRSSDESGNDEGWVKETISLNQYTGQSVLIRFEVLTDSAVLGRGFALDDIAIPELGYESDVETAVLDWEAKGFVQTGWQLPQQWAVQYIQLGPQPTVTPLPLNAQNQGQWSFEVDKGGGVLVILPLTPFTTDPASYWLSIQ